MKDSCRQKHTSIGREGRYESCGETWRLNEWGKERMGSPLLPSGRRTHGGHTRSLLRGNQIGLSARMKARKYGFAVSGRAVRTKRWCQT